MIKRIKGKCKFCGKEYTMSYMNRHLPACKVRQELIQSEPPGNACGYFELAVLPKYNRDYWLFIEMRETAKLKDLDTFLRDIWLECCGHLSAFEIDGISYDVAPSDGFWGEKPRSMNYQLKTVLRKGKTIGYQYDFGSTTELTITAVNYRIHTGKREKISILSRNNPHVWMCASCQKKAAVYICPICYWEGTGMLCEDCAETHECGEEFLLRVCNSPRMGICGYNGSIDYPDQFISDPEKFFTKKERL